jgi:hypothetical protein
VSTNENKHERHLQVKLYNTSGIFAGRADFLFDKFYHNAAKNPIFANYPVDIFSSSKRTSIFKPTISLKPVFQPASLRSLVRNRAYATII